MRAFEVFVQDKIMNSDKRTFSLDSEIYWSTSPFQKKAVRSQVKTNISLLTLLL